MPFNECMSSSGLHFTCFFSEMLIILIFQIPVFYSLACVLDKSDWKTRFWRIYFFCITLIHLFFYSAALTDNSYNRLDRIILLLDIPLVLTAFLGLCLLSFRRKLFNALFWKTFFCIYIAWEFTINILMQHLPLSAIIQAIILFGPLYMALYLYGFKFWKVERGFWPGKGKYRDWNHGRFALNSRSMRCCASTAFICHPATAGWELKRF